MQLSIKKIFLYVITIHLLFFLSCLDTRSLARKKEKIKIKTIRLSPAIQNLKKEVEISHKISKENEPIALLPKAVPAKSEKSQEKPKSVNKPEKKNVTAQKETKVAKQPESSAIRKKLLSDAQEKIAKIASVPIKQNGEKSKQAFELLSESTSETIEYADEITTLLQSSLRLPEGGDVTLSLKLKRSGNVVEVGILSSASEKNKNYVKTKLPQVRFPSFNDEFRGEEEHTFYITLSDIK